VTDQEGIKLLMQARAIIQNPDHKHNTCVIIASRPTRWISSFHENDKTVISVQANELNETEVLHLLCRISKTELNRILFCSDSFRLLAHTWLTDKTPETPINSSLRPANKFAPTRTKSAEAD
jgi:hypothetical protein